MQNMQQYFMQTLYSDITKLPYEIRSCFVLEQSLTIFTV